MPWYTTEHARRDAERQVTQRSKTMSTKIYTEKNGAWTVFERLMPSGMYAVRLYSPAGSLLDKVRCDDRREAQAYLRSFRAIAKNQ